MPLTRSLMFGPEPIDLLSLRFGKLRDAAMVFSR